MILVLKMFSNMNSCLIYCFIEISRIVMLEISCSEPKSIITLTNEKLYFLHLHLCILLTFSQKTKINNFTFKTKYSFEIKNMISSNEQFTTLCKNLRHMGALEEG